MGTLPEVDTLFGDDDDVGRCDRLEQGRQSSHRGVVPVIGRRHHHDVTVQQLEPAIDRPSSRGRSAAVNPRRHHRNRETSRLGIGSSSGWVLPSCRSAYPSAGSDQRASSIGTM